MGINTEILQFSQKQAFQEVCFFLLDLIFFLKFMPKDGMLGGTYDKNPEWAV